MNFYEHRGRLVSEGEKGTYCITNGNWFYLERMTPINDNIHVEQLGAFYSENEAITAAGFKNLFWQLCNTQR